MEGHCRHKKEVVRQTDHAAVVLGHNLVVLGHNLVVLGSGQPPGCAG